VKPGQTVTWIDGDINSDRHTITSVTKAHVPRTRQAVNLCPFCFLANGHFSNPDDPNSAIVALKLQVGRSGYQTEGDSLLLQNRHRISAQIKAPAGRTVYYFCRVRGTCAFVTEVIVWRSELMSPSIQVTVWPGFT